MSDLEKFILGIGLIGFAVGFITQFRLKKYVSLEKVRAITDPSEIYANCIPPKKVLTDKGIKIHRLFIGGGVIFIGSILALMILGVSK